MFHLVPNEILVFEVSVLQNIDNNFLPSPVES